MKAAQRHGDSQSLSMDEVLSHRFYGKNADFYARENLDSISPTNEATMPTAE